MRLYGRMREKLPSSGGRGRAAAEPANRVSPPKTSESPSFAAQTPEPQAKPAGDDGFPPSPMAEKPSGLADHYPWARVPLPGESEFVKTESVEDTEKYIEYTYVHLALTKAEAVAYFRPLLEKDADFFTLDDDLPHPPLEVRGAYPEAASYVSLFSRYAAETEANISVIKVDVYTAADGETVLAAVVQVNYRSKPE